MTEKMSKMSCRCVARCFFYVFLAVSRDFRVYSSLSRVKQKFEKRWSKQRQHRSEA